MLPGELRCMVVHVPDGDVHVAQGGEKAIACLEEGKKGRVVIV